MRLAACIVAFACTACWGQAFTARTRIVSSNEIRGAALARDGRLFTWGDGLTVRDPGLKTARVLAKTSFGEAGCLVDVDGDGQEEFVGKEGVGLGPLTWRAPPHYKPVILERQTDTHDCIDATLFGRRGVLAIHRHMQVRFYEPGSAGKPWNVREIYSIYTPSQQAGLSLGDIDGDGRVDIVCGNYWIRSPERFDLPWNIFAMNTWFELPQSAMLAHGATDDGFFIAQAHMTPARVAVFTRPGNVRQLWKESRLEGNFHRVHTAVSFEGGLLFAENNGRASRVFELRDSSVRQVAQGVDTLRLFVLSDAALAVGPRELVVWDYRRK
jgi:hypothetical protein